MTATNRQIVLKSRAEGWVTPDNFEMREVALPEIGEGDVLVRALYMSLDPYMRSRIGIDRPPADRIPLGGPMEARVVGCVAASRHPDFREGDQVYGSLDWADYSVAAGGKGLRPLPDARQGGKPVPLAWHLGALGMPGMTAWIGMQIAQPKSGETLFVSAASGVVGQIVGQIAKLMGLRAVGSAGTDAKAAFLTGELGFDAAFNYKTAAPDILSALQGCVPGGLDIYFDNVGGPLLEAALDAANLRARIIACGMISQYNLVREETPGVRNLTHINRKRIRMQGIGISDHDHRQAEFLEEMSGWLASGQVTYRVDVADGLENAPAAFVAMLKGENFGKQVVKIGSEP
ncbi:MAG: NADP-dependent oxidoreductase [Rhodospirillales bacterium]